MTQEQAVKLLMSEWKVGDAFKNFFAKTVSDYMGTAKNVMSEDINNIRKIIQESR